MEVKNWFALVAVLALAGIAILYLEGQKATPASTPPIAPAEGAGVDYSVYPRAPELAGISGYINAKDGFRIADLKGKVVLVDFWTYSCINCIRTLPYLNSWHEKYAKDGLVIIGVHTPEFDFEKEYENVLGAVQKNGIKYPVVQDNDFASWRAYQNQYWPHKYLIDAQGRIRYDHIGEGGYDETEAQIVELLKEAKNGQVAMNVTKPNATAVDFGKIRTPEIYFGQSFRRAPFGNAQPLFEGQEFAASIPEDELTPNIAYLEGRWRNGKDGATLVSEKGAVELIFTAKNVNIVAGSANGTKLTMFIDGKRVGMQRYCPDAPYGTCDVSEQRLYTIIVLPDYGSHRLRMEAQGAGLEMFTFTFG